MEPETLIALAVLAGAFVLGVLWRWKSAPVERRPRQWRSSWGTVYVYQDKDRPSRFKVGTTTQLTRKRKAGVRSAVKQVTGEAPTLRQVFAIDMHHAREVERLALDALERWKAPIGTMGEFFDFGDMPEKIAREFVAHEVRKAAAEVRRRARKRRIGRWTEKKESAARMWMLTDRGPVRRPLFQT